MKMARKTKKYIIKPILAALFLALGMVLPLLTGQIKEIGDSLLPMHIPVMICGLVCGYKYGAAVGLMLPFLRSLTFSIVVSRIPAADDFSLIIKHHLHLYFHFYLIYL